MGDTASEQGDRAADSGDDPERIADLIEQIKESADKLAKDRTSRGDLKILSRTLRELRYAFKVFTPYRRRRKVTVFGSARTQPAEPAYLQAIEFGRAMAEHKWLVVTGAASGIMEAAHVGSGREHAMGLNIMLPFEQYANSVIAGDSKLVHMKYFFTRKLMFVKECDAVCLLPGGFGTLDEGLEVLTLLADRQARYGPRRVSRCAGWHVLAGAAGLLFPPAAWRSFDFRPKIARFICSPTMWSVAVDEILGFFRVYHSMRYVKNKLVIRLARRPTAELMTTINRDFRELLTRGEFELGSRTARGARRTRVDGTAAAHLSL